jgi:hypothetical protein
MRPIAKLESCFRAELHSVLRVCIDIIMLGAKRAANVSGSERQPICSLRPRKTPFEWLKTAHSSDVKMSLNIDIADSPLSRLRCPSPFRASR